MRPPFDARTDPVISGGPPRRRRWQSARPGGDEEWLTTRPVRLLAVVAPHAERRSHEVASREFFQFVVSVAEFSQNGAGVFAETRHGTQ